MAHFAERGFHSARVGDIAMSWALRRVRSSNISTAKTDCSSKSTKGRAVVSRCTWTRPRKFSDSGFFEMLRYWLARTEHLVHEDWIPYRISLIGNYGTDLALKREINRFLISGRSVRYGQLCAIRARARRTSRRSGPSR